MKKVKNNTGSNKTWCGQTIAPAAYYTLLPHEALWWGYDSELLTAIAASEAVVNDGSLDLNTTDGPLYLQAVDAGRIGGVLVDPTGIGDQKRLTYDLATNKLKFVADSPGNAAGAKGQIQVRGVNAGTFTAFSGLTWDDTRLALLIGDDPGNVGGVAATMKKSRNSWIQSIIQNMSTGTQATADFCAMNDAGNDDSGYIDMGINGSGYNDPAYPLSVAYDSYLYCDGGNLTVGTYTPTKSLILHAGGFGLDKERIRLTDATAAKDAFVVLSSVLKLVNDTTANRPTTPANGMLRYNTTSSAFEGYEGGAWVNLRSGEANTASNVGAGAGTIYKQKTGVNLELKTIKAGANISITNNASEIEIASSGGSQGSAYLQNLTLSDGSAAYLQCAVGTYTAVSRCIFPGSNTVTLNKVLATCSIGGGTSMSIRVYDLTNSQVVCEKTGITDVTTSIHDLGTISNIPASQAVFEIQLAAVGNGGKARVSSVLLRS